MRMRISNWPAAASASVRLRSYRFAAAATSDLLTVWRPQKSTQRYKRKAQGHERKAEGGERRAKVYRPAKICTTIIFIVCFLLSPVFFRPQSIRFHISSKFSSDERHESVVFFF